MCNETYVTNFKKLLLEVFKTTEKSGINLWTSRFLDRESNPEPAYYEAGVVILMRGPTAQQL
jgi:hypothetical protein